MTGQLTGRVVKAALFPHARLEFAHELAAVLARRVQLFHEFLLADHKIKLDAFDLVKGLANAGGQAAAVEGQAYIGGTVTLAQGSYLGLVNAKEGSFVLAGEGKITDSGAQVVTDNPFITGSLDAASGTVTAAIDTESGLQSIASLGMQAVTRRADSVLAATIADRTSFGQDLKPGMNLWVDVAGENYQMDDMDNGGEFEAGDCQVIFPRFA